MYEVAGVRLQDSKGGSPRAGKGLAGAVRIAAALLLQLTLGSCS
jgi:hypothetical protein